MPSYGTALKLLFRGLVSSILLCLTISFIKTIELMSDHEYAISREAQHKVAMGGGGKQIRISPLMHESMFVETIKECIIESDDDKKSLRGKECKTFIPPNEKKERVALLSPPGKATTMVLKFISVVLKKARKGKDVQIADSLINIIPETHMAPYGYGKTHGYTRIMRVFPQPLLLGTTDTLKAAVESLTSFSNSDLTMNDLKAALRQQIRYHCRLNHVAAHTSMWSIGLEDFAEIEREIIVEKAKTFFNLNPQDDLLNEVMNEYEGVDNNDDTDQSNKVNYMDDDNAVVRLNKMYEDGELLLNRIQINEERKKLSENKENADRNDVLKLLNDVLLDEMKISKNLTDWPCQSFWTVGEPENRNEISPIIQHISKAMSPNCTALHTSCFVKRDKCEFNGDGPCQ